MEYNRLEIKDFPQAPDGGYWKLELAERPAWGQLSTQYYKLTLVHPDHSVVDEDFTSITNDSLAARAGNLWWRYEQWRRDQLLNQGPVEIITKTLKGGEILG